MKANQREPTYKQFITGPIKRFDERQTGFSRADRGEIKRPSEALHHGLKTKAAKDELGHTREDYALNLAARTIDTMIRKMAYSREDLSRRWSMEGDPTPVTDATEISGKV
nr:hypothetical protein [Desulfobacterales bacterium]